MRGNTYKLINNLTTAIIILVAGVTPILFLNLTTNFYDIPKLIFLIIASVVLLVLWILSWIAKGKIIIVRTPLDVPLLMFLVVVIASTVFSSSKNPSIYGIFPEVHGSAVSWVTYIVLYFVAVSNLRKTRQVRVLLYVLYGSAILLSLISLFSFFGVFLPIDIAKSYNFTPAGTTFSVIAFLLMVLPLSLISIVKRNNHLPQTVAVVLSTLFSLVIILTGSFTSYVILFLLFGATLFITRSHLTNNNLILFLVPSILSALMLLLVLIPFSLNKINDMRNVFPQEVQLPSNISWKISATAFRDAPLVGTGPSTYLFNFTNHKPAEFNQLKFWNFSFGSAYNEFFQVLATLGILGLVSLFVFSIVIVTSSRKYLFTKNQALYGSSDNAHAILPSLALSGIVAVVLLFVHATTLVSIVTTLFIVGAFMVLQKNIREKTTEISIGVGISSSGNKHLDLLPVLVFVIFLVVSIPLSRRIYNAIAADYYHRLALSQADKDGTKTYEYLQKAETLNPYIDLYRVDMAQTNFALANALAAQKGPTEQNPNGTLTDEDKLTIQTLVAQAINEGRASVVLSPRSSRNWEVLALIYRNITGVANNAITFSLDAYGRAIQMDPLNPVLRVNVGSIYYATGDYDLAVRFYTDAINLKPDYVNGYYNLAIALRDKGDLQNAQLVAEQAVSLLQQELSSQEYSKISESLKETKVKDFNTAFNLLNEIRGEVGAVDESETTDEGALQNPELPAISVPDLENPPETTVPPAVEENPDAAIPQLNSEDSAASSPTPVP